MIANNTTNNNIKSIHKWFQDCQSKYALKKHIIKYSKLLNSILAKLFDK